METDDGGCLMSDTRQVEVRLMPIGTVLKVPAGTPMRDFLFEQGVEFPCGGNGRCRGCKVRLMAGDAAINDAQREHLSPKELAEGWRLACQCSVDENVTIELRQWDASILSNETAFSFTPHEGLGVAVDIGTTTVVAQLLDLETGHVLGVRTSLNPQARHGGDVMSRVQYAVAEGGLNELRDLIRHEVGRLIRQLFAASGADAERLTRIVLVGNTVMHHLFCGIDLEPLSRYPFEPVRDGLERMSAQELGWDLKPDVYADFLPCLGGFVGSDILAGILATGVHRAEGLEALVDLGTNGEIVLANRNRLICASTAAGPAFEGARIAAGMRASTGAIWKVQAQNGGVHCEVLGNAEPRGICGSGLVDAVAVGLELGAIRPSGKLSNGRDWRLCGDVVLTQTDVRQLQLAKGAIAAGIRLLLNRWGAGFEDVHRLYLAGAFGNYVDRNSARKIGLLQMPLERVSPAGNTALLGAKMALFSDDHETEGYAAIRERAEHVGLNEDPMFQDVYVEEMVFPS
jgi:uncharacterized 2Fe-2S/4Fe-4S cluster protein (DUF4445 family)